MFGFGEAVAPVGALGQRQRVSVFISAAAAAAAAAAWCVVQIDTA
jgi:hypothetical protein